MIVGICQVELRVYNCISLKSKRQVIKSIIERLKSRYNISIAEVGDNDIWQKSLLGFSCVSNSKKHIESVISNVFNFIENDERVEIISTDIEIV
ncbi:uncharacterized protein YlxP (DUF503 family) [Acetoanaerobium pronyense]|uniref:Uncharacterized protein YlxP (DUF503 family) n=1 Tax=Acetoanaerobium pronyense TaxID=1482736 RepID=A0ABS4KHZ1_9FIRM|nr:DUF503 domain-containing protein [Acetoanaerobium pronyense]MBP2026985.1 uncharacterized protein YlxP (DUF503 family) [Acetoanaerobium pronyense]